MIKTSFIAVVCLALMRAAAADYEQAPGHFGGFGSDSSFAVADEFQLSEDTSVRKIVWWGGYLVDGPAPDTDEFTIRIYADNNGEPGALLLEVSGEKIKRHRTGKFVQEDRERPEYQYTLNLPTPFQAAAGTKYWLSIVNTGDWLWEVSDSLLNWGVQRAPWTDPVFGPWTPYLDNTAFMLDGRK